MSGYNEETGIFELTSTKADFWFRRNDLPDELYKICECCGQATVTKWELIIGVLKWQGLEVIKDGGNYLHVKATPDQMWEALSGKPSDPNIAKRHYRK